MLADSQEKKGKKIHRDSMSGASSALVFACCAFFIIFGFASIAKAQNETQATLYPNEGLSLSLSLWSFALVLEQTYFTSGLLSF